MHTSKAELGFKSRSKCGGEFGRGSAIRAWPSSNGGVLETSHNPLSEPSQAMRGLTVVTQNGSYELGFVAELALQREQLGQVHEGGVLLGFLSDAIGDGGAVGAHSKLGDAKRTSAGGIGDALYL